MVREEMEELLVQHTDETGQRFEGNALERIWELTQGQPWLVNALAYEICFEQKKARDRSLVITSEMVEDAKYELILRRETHLDQLADKLKEDRARRVIEPILAGESDQISERDAEYLVDLGLIKKELGMPFQIPNPIYAEIIPRELMQSTQNGLIHQSAWYIKQDKSLDMIKLMEAFQEFYQENAEVWLKGIAYKEAAPQLLLQAFLQRIVNGGGRIEREYALGSRRTDLLIKWNRGDENHRQWQKIVVELKVIRRGLEKTLEEGLKQVSEYADRCSAEEIHLAMFDRDFTKSWEEKLSHEIQQSGSKSIHVWKM